MDEMLKQKNVLTLSPTALPTLRPQMFFDETTIFLCSFFKKDDKNNLTPGGSHERLMKI